MPSHGALTLFFRWRKKSVQKKASGTATPKAAHIAMHCGQALRCAWAWLRASWLSAISGASRPSASLGRGLRPAAAHSGLSSSTGCPVSHSSLPVALLASHPPCGSLWAAPKAPLEPRFPSGQFAALTRRKRLLLPILTAGLAMSRAMELDSFHQLLECARARLFRRQNGRAFFPPLPIAALLPRSWR